MGVKGLNALNTIQLTPRSLLYALCQCNALKFKLHLHQRPLGVLIIKSDPGAFPQKLNRPEKLINHFPLTTQAYSCRNKTAEIDNSGWGISEKLGRQCRLREAYVTEMTEV